MASPKKLLPPKLFCEEVLKKAPKEWCFVFDFDGTLVDFHPDPRKVTLSSLAKEALSRLNSKLGSRVLILSGRDYSQLQKYFNESQYAMVGNHGARSNYLELVAGTQDFGSTGIDVFLSGLSQQYPGSFVEDKIYSRVFHFRRCKHPPSSRLQRQWALELKELAAGTPLEASLLNKAIEVKDSRCSKFHLIGELFKDAFVGRGIVCFGDDKTEEQVFQAYSANQNLVSVAVGDRIQDADFRIASPKKLASWLFELSSEI